MDGARRSVDGVANRSRLGTRYFRLKGNLQVTFLPPTLTHSGVRITMHNIDATLLILAGVICVSLMRPLPAAVIGAFGLFILLR